LRRYNVITVKENELYREIELFEDDVKIGEAEVDLKNHMLSRLVIYELYQNRGFGTEVVKILTERYNLNNLWVRADNSRAIHVYEKCGYKVGKPTMYEMVANPKEE
jgi:RimJ/RimL family protein N-acetyltransferase